MIQQQLVPAAVRAGLYGDAQRSADGVFEGGCCRDVVGVWGGSRRPGLSAADDFSFEVPDGPIAVGGAVSELPSAVVVGFAEKRLAVALGEPSAVDQLDRLVGEIE